MSSWAKSCVHCGWTRYRPFLRLSWAFVFVLSVLGMIGLLFAIFSGTMSAPQQGAAAACSTGLAVIPYVWARAIEKIG